jgi:hypothetical protein
METVFYSLVSVLGRSITGVMDRYSFGTKKQPIIYTNLVNNFIPFLILALFLACLGQTHSLADAKINWRIATVGFAVQAVGFAFSYGFRNGTVAQVNVAARGGDVLIPIALMAVGVKVSFNDFAFAMLMSLTMLLAFPGRGATSGGMVKVAVVIAAALVVQSLIAEVAFTSRNGVGVFAVCASTLFWRSVLCVLLLPLSTNSRAALGMFGFATLKDHGGWLFGRTIATIASQATFIYVLTYGTRVVAWPILNSVAVFSVTLSSVFLREKARKREWVAAFGILVLSTARSIL